MSKLYSKSLLFSLSFLLASILSNAQQKNIRFDRYAIEDGLSQSSVTGVVQDNLGFIWVATQDGLNRYDGYDFLVFKSIPEDNSTLPNNYLYFLQKDEYGHLWFGTNRGIGFLNPVNFKITRINRELFPGIRGYVFTHMGFDANGHIWALSDKYGINKIDLRTKEVEIIKSINENAGFTCMFIDKAKTAWVGTETGQIYYSAPPYQSFFEIDQVQKTPSSINQISQNGSSSLLVSTKTGIFTIDEDKIMRPLGDNKILEYLDITCAYRENEENIWIGSNESGLFLLKQDSSGREKIFQYKTNPYNNSSIQDDHVSNIFEDNNGVFWIGAEKGFSKFDKYKQGFATISLNNDPDHGLVDFNVWSIAENKNGDVYIGTKKDLTIYKTDEQKFYHIYRDNSTQNYLLSIYVETPEKIWLGYDDGLYILTISNLKAGAYSFKKVDFQTANSHSNDLRVYQIVPADDKRLWIGSRLGLSIIDRQNLDYSFYAKTDSDNSIGEGSVKVIYRDLSGKIWLVTSDQGLYNIVEKPDGSFYFKHYPIANHNEQNAHITCLLQTEKNSLWLGTYGDGIKRLDLTTNETTNYTETQGLANNVIYGMLEDDQKNIWASTNKGISKFNPENEQFTNYTVKDGLQSNEFNTNAFFKSSEGLLYFGGINGYTVFNPHMINKNPNEPSAIISRVLLSSKGANNREVIAQNISSFTQLNLEFDQNDISFEFISTNYSNTGKTRYKYILEGHEEEYTYLEHENKVNYLNIPHGEYTLKVFAQSGDGVWSSEPTTIGIHITPPFWLTWWFRILIILALTALGIGIYRRRVDVIRRQKVRLEIEVVKRTRQITEQHKKIEDQKKKVEIQKAKIEHQKELLEKEKEKVEQLLLNILPEGTAEELKKEGRSKARYYKNVSVMFTDFVGFSKIAEDMKPQELVQKLDSYFSKFDEIIEKYDLEKIKTIGDSYMCAGGVPIRNKSNAIEVCLSALEIKDYMLDRQKAAIERGEKDWEIRIGINTGEVIAGVIGIKRFAYDIWGATVNQAQRMEMHGQPGTVNVSGNTYEYIAPYFECTYRGKVQTKHKGMLDMYYVSGIKPELSIKGEGKKPNNKFWKIVDLHLYSSINYMKAERHIMKILETQLSPKLLYHSINHTIDVTKAVERLAIMEGITDEDLFLLKSAATYHDAGFIEKYEKNEEIGMRLAREILPKYGYTKEQIDVIDGLIKATEIPQTPNSHLQQIMCDADLDYLGRDDFHDIANLLRRELREHGKLNSDRMWDEIQVKFLTAHTYFTKSAIRLRQEKKMKHIEEIKAKLLVYDYKD
jgi:ligand-binding sensor domain-containing protein/class 3 adenylate cyclase/predicted metal-dependent HD superfamily phosphohydrolase